MTQAENYASEVAWKQFQTDEEMKYSLLLTTWTNFVDTVATAGELPDADELQPSDVMETAWRTGFEYAFHTMDTEVTV